MIDGEKLPTNKEMQEMAAHHRAQRALGVHQVITQSHQVVVDDVGEAGPVISGDMPQSRPYDFGHGKR